MDGEEIFLIQNSWGSGTFILDRSAAADRPWRGYNNMLLVKANVQLTNRLSGVNVAARLVARLI